MKSKMWCVLLLLLMAISTSSPTHLNKGFVAQLIHKTSHVSPFYSSNSTTQLLQKQSIAISAACNHHFTHPLSYSEMAPPSNHDFVMLFSLGSPSAKAFGIPDTAPDLFWLRCGPSYTFLDPPGPLYDPYKLLTHHYIPCNSHFCRWFPHNSCSVDGNCTYAAFYPDKSYSMGEVVADYSFYFKVGISSTTANHIFFGCGTLNFDSGGQGLPGVVGLRMGMKFINFTKSTQASRGADSELLQYIFTAAADVSLSSVGSQSSSCDENTSMDLSGPPSFSYCHNAAQMGGYIRFGSESILEQGDQSPLLPNTYGNYHLGLEGINVDGQQVAFSSDFFRMEDGPTETGFIVDTGTTYTMLYREAFDQFLAAIKDTNAMRDRKVYQALIWDLCYDDISGAPEIELLFSGLAFPLSDDNMWVEGPEGLFCLAVKPTLNRLSVLGMYQQRSINVGFDLVNSQLWFQYQSNCPEYVDGA